MSEPERLRQSPKYKAWKRIVEKNGCVVGGAEILQDIPRRDGTILFAMIDAKVADPDGRPLPRYLVLRGSACVVVTVVENRETGERKFLMLRQRRIGNGADSLEFPAGMLASSVDDPGGVAVKELEEETGLKVGRDTIKPLSDHPLYSSSGLDDEAIHYFTCTVSLLTKEYQGLHGGHGGNAEEGEFIRMELWDYPDAVREVTSIQVRLGFHLYFERMNGDRSGRVPPAPR